MNVPEGNIITKMLNIVKQKKNKIICFENLEIMFSSKCLTGGIKQLDVVDERKKYVK